MTPCANEFLRHALEKRLASMYLVEDMRVADHGDGQIVAYRATPKAHVAANAEYRVAFVKRDGGHFDVLWDNVARELK